MSCYTATKIQGVVEQSPEYGRFESINKMFTLFSLKKNSCLLLYPPFMQQETIFKGFFVYFDQGLPPSSNIIKEHLYHQNYCILALFIVRMARKFLSDLYIGVY